MKANELKAVVYADLLKRGFDVVLNYKVNLNYPSRGYKVVYLDLVVLSSSGAIATFYIGKENFRRRLKYRVTKLPIFTITDASEIEKGITEFYNWYIKNILKYK